MVLDDFVGLPYQTHGRSLEGVDCWGLVWLAAWHLYGLRLPSYTSCYTPKAGFLEMEQVIDNSIENWERVEGRQEKEGDVALLRLRGRPVHCGLVVSRGKVLHIKEGMGSILERYHQRLKVYGFYRYNP